MDSAQIESKAVSAVEQLIWEYDKLSPQINKSDKLPLWDGYIFIHNASNHCNDNMKGKVPLQVKGKVKGLKGNIISYSVQINALRQYQQEGVAYFVVDIATNTVYYSLLDPLEIKSNLEKAKGVKSCSIQLRNVESHKSTFYNEVVEFYENCKRQKSYWDLPQNSIEDVLKQGGNTLTLMLVGERNIETYRSLSDRNIRVYWNKGDCLLPLKNDYQIKGGSRISQPVSINGKIFFNGCLCLFEKDSFVYHFNNSTTFTIYENKNNPSRLDYQQKARTLKQLLFELEFLVTLIEQKSFVFGNVEISGFDVGDIKELKEIADKWDFFKKVADVFKQLHIKEDLNITNLSPADYNTLNFLIKVFVDKKSLSLPNKPNINSIVEVSNIKIYLLFIPTKDGKYTVDDFFNREKILLIQTADGEKIPVPIQYFLTPDDYNNLSNVDYEGIMPMIEYINSKIRSYNYEYFNKILLDLLAAYDLNNNNKSALNVAQQLAKWLKDNCKGVECKPNHIINHIQALERAGNKGDDEDNMLLDLIDQYPKRFDIQTAANLLLGQTKTAMRFFNKMSQTEQENFKNFPIGHYLPSEISQSNI